MASSKAFIFTQNKYLLSVPPSFANGFYTLCDVIYKCTEYYHLEDEHIII
ncbi:dTDP-4-dehydrorhamnose 3,5-epimerase family protein [Candidatus Coxiella mudrowiae]